LNEKNNNKNNKVLKIFNNIDVNINNIKDYLSLEIIKIFNNQNDISSINL
jgi:hypothetical protein